MHALMSAGKIALGLFGLLFVGAIALVAWGIGVNNKIVGLEQSADAQWAQVQNVYQRRADLVPNLVNTVSGAANFERSTLTEITEARATVGRVNLPATAPSDPRQLEQFEQAQSRLGGALSRLLVVAEKYPDLKATTNFRDLQVQLEGTENRIAVERGRFNEVVRDYNTSIRRFPASVIAGIGGFAPKAYFAATPGAETPPAVNFDFSRQGATAPAPAK